MTQQPPPDSGWSPAPSLTQSRHRTSFWNLWGILYLCLAAFAGLFVFLVVDGNQWRQTGDRGQFESLADREEHTTRITWHIGGLFVVMGSLFALSCVIWNVRRHRATTAHGSIYFGQRPPRRLRSRGAAPGGTGEVAHEVTISSAGADGAQSTVRGPWTHREGVLWTHEIDIRVRTGAAMVPSPPHWWRVYSSGASATVEVKASDAPGAPFTLDHGRDTGWGAATNTLDTENAPGLTLGLAVSEEAEGNPASWVAESVDGVKRLPERVRDMLEADRELLALVQRPDVIAIRAYETVIGDRETVTFVGSWPAPKASASGEAYRGASGQPASVERPDGYLFLGTLAAWQAWLGRRQRVERELWLHLALAAVMMTVGAWMFGANLR